MYVICVMNIEMPYIWVFQLLLFWLSFSLPPEVGNFIFVNIMQKTGFWTKLLE